MQKVLDIEWIGEVAMALAHGLVDYEIRKPVLISAVKINQGYNYLMPKLIHKIPVTVQ